eukprot:TRINITY_DN4834_c0_g1_i2.p2 TRINITY_DN4834_c0_g1~~TRINITY_DN4834_c0_g1_i2.p2  ORF type:complete len:134 (+),score=25.21 TRINITY_DN4834_c0_g1_i2:72-473(+)
MAGISSRSSSLPNLAEKVEKVDLDKLGASCAEPGCHALQSAGAKCIYRKPNAEYGRFYHDPRKAGEFKIATKFPLPVADCSFSRLHGSRGHSATRLPGQPGFYRHDGLNVQLGVKDQRPRNTAHKDWIQKLLG